MNLVDIISLVNHPHVVKIFFLTFSGLLIRQSLVIVGQRWANTYHHLATYLLLPNIALIITSIIKDDIALSLGMIGALSIVRFRNPVKSPFELVLFFALMTLGIVSSVSLTLSFLLSALVIVIIFGIKISDVIVKKFGGSIFQFSFGDGNLLYTIEINASEAISDIEKNKSLIHFYIDKKNNNYSYRLVFKNKNDLINFENKIREDKRVINLKADMQS